MNAVELLKRAIIKLNDFRSDQGKRELKAA
jgi:hypothetical protein